MLYATARGEQSFILLGEAPYVAVLGPDGTAMGTPDFDVPWVADAEKAYLHAAPDGTLVVVAFVAPINGARVHVERWSDAGVKLFADTFPGGYDTAAMTPDGTLVLADRTSLSFFTSDDTFSSIAVVPGPDHPEHRTSDPGVVAASEAGSTIWVDTSSGTFVYGYDLQGNPRGATAMMATDRSCALSVDRSGFASVACMRTGSSLELSVTRYDPQQATAWSDDDVGGLADGINRVTTAATASSVVTAIATQSTVRVQRHTSAGSRVGHQLFKGTVNIAGVGVVARADGEDFFLLHSTHRTASGIETRGLQEVKRLRVRSLAHGTRQEGEACGEAMDCESNVCCVALGGEATCGTLEGCPPGATCAASEDCAGGAACTRALGWPGPGVCWSQCSDDCEAGFACTSPAGQGPELLCLPDCLAEGNAACSDLPNHVCTELTDAAGFRARACVGQGDDTSSSSECAFDDDCGAGSTCSLGRCTPESTGCDGCMTTGAACTADAQCASGNCCVEGAAPQCSDMSCDRGVPGTLCEHDLECETLDCQSDGLCAPRMGQSGEPCSTPADCASFVCCLGQCAQRGDCFEGDFGTPCLGQWECLSGFDCHGADVATRTLGYCSKDCVIDTSCETALGSNVEAVCVLPVLTPDSGYCAATCTSDLDCAPSVTHCTQPAGASSMVCDRL